MCVASDKDGGIRADAWEGPDDALSKLARVARRRLG